MIGTTLRNFLGMIGMVTLVAYAAMAGLMASPALDAPAVAQTQGQVPGNALGNVNDAEFWRAVRRGVSGTVSIPDKKAGVLVQSEGDNWRVFRNGPLSNFGGWLLLASVVVLAVFFAWRGRIRIDRGPSGRTVERFNALERFTHWLAAGSFVVLGLTGLNVMYGKYVLMPILGADAFAALTYWGKLSHSYIAFAFMIGIVLMFILWVKDNFFDSTDLEWISKAGGLFSSGVHPPARKFNFGQKFIFWAVILGGGSLSISGLALMFPFEITPFAGTFAVLNVFGFGLPTELSPLAETQLSHLWHGILGLVMIAIIIAHIYIGSLGMEGAFDAVSTGQVDENWARENHSLWVAELEGGAAPPQSGGEQPAE
ncbi:MAG: formate dehydrogenase subunit gamma [Rhodospirillales bacterium]|nr:formate dehydrogenase subunit gamma [Rhodospirillales bacterium]MDP6774745.1 formate dehydrogenase subunit gamma [Rhodospirillales bacterium]